MANDINGPLRNVLPGNIDQWNRVYATVADANAAIPSTVVGSRNFREGKVVQIGTVTDFVEHHWFGGFGDNNLIPKGVDPNILKGYQVLTTTVVEGKYLHPFTGAEVTNAALKYTKITVPTDRKVRVTTNLLGDQVYAALYLNPNGTVKSREQVGTVGGLQLNKYELTIPTDVTEIAVEGRVGYPMIIETYQFFTPAKASDIESLDGDIATLGAEINDLESTLNDTLMGFNPKEISVKEGFYIHPFTGAETAYNTQKYTLITVPQSRKIRVTTRISGGSVWLAIYGSDTAIIGREGNGNNTTPLDFDKYELTIPAAATRIFIGGLVGIPLIVEEYGKLTFATNEVILQTISENIKRFMFVNGFPKDILFIPSYGQSNSVGGGNGQPATPQRYDALVPISGIRPNVSGVWDVSEFKPYAHDGTTIPLIGVFNKFTELINDRAFLPYQQKGFQFLGAATGEGSKTISQLAKGTTFYNRQLALLEQLVATCNVKKITVNVPFFAFTQGENDIGFTTYSQYLTSLYQLIIDINTDFKARVPGQVNSIPFISYQVAHGTPSTPDYDGISKAHLEAGLKNPLFVCACPSYFWPYVHEGYTTENPTSGYYIHFAPQSRIMYGAYIAIAAYKTLVTGVKFLPMHVVSIVKSGNNLEVFYHLPFDDGRLVFDTTTITNPGNYGFRVLDSQGVDIALTNVRISGRNSVNISCASDPVGGKLLYANDWSKPVVPSSDNLTGILGSRGCLRDNQGDYIKTTEGYPLHNWAVKTSMEIS